MATGALDFKAGNAIVQAAGCAVGAFKAADDISERARKRAEELDDSALDEAIRIAVEKALEGMGHPPRAHESLLDDLGLS